MPGVTWTEGTVSTEGWTRGTPKPGSNVRILFGAIVLNQANFKQDAAASYTEGTVSSVTFTEDTVSSVTWTERSL